MHVKFETVIINSELNANLHLTLKLEILEVKVKDNGHHGVYMHVKFKRFIVKSFPTIDLNANFNLTPKLEMSKVKVKDKGRNG